MRISDWSSDVCSSDLHQPARVREYSCANRCVAYSKYAHYMHCMSDTLAFMIADTSRLLRRSFDERTRVIGITGAQWRLLFTVSRNEGQNQGATAELLEVEPITLCRMIDRMDDAGMVERRPDPNDRREIGRAWCRERVCKHV